LNGGLLQTNNSTQKPIKLCKLLSNCGKPLRESRFILTTFALSI
jgi:hypothetical protein